MRLARFGARRMIMQEESRSPSIFAGPVLFQCCHGMDRLVFSSVNGIMDSRDSRREREPLPHRDTYLCSVRSFST